MRNLIIGLSILFFALSGIIIFKALGIPVKNTNYQNDREGLRSKGISSKENIETKESKEKTRVLAVLGDGAFLPGQVVIDENQINAVKEVVPDILASSHNRVIIEGHTDNTPIKPSTEKRYLDNMELSVLRAKAVASVLVKNGISPERISVIGYGDTYPIASNDTDEGRIKNRRVEIKLIPEDKEF